MANVDKKRLLIAKIHIAKKDMGLDDGTYRDMLKRVTGKDSSKNMSIPQLQKVINEFGLYGWKPTASNTTAKRYGKKPTASSERPDRQSMINKVEAIVADMDLHWNYVHAMCRNMFDKLQLQFCTDDELFKVVQALSVYQRRKKQQTTEG